MKVLLDTHFLIWLFTDTAKTESEIFEILKNPKNEIYYIQASVWEISIKYSLKKLERSGGTPEELYKEIRHSFLKCKFFDNNELSTFCKLPKEHKDPFDRIMVWQAINIPRSERRDMNPSARINKNADRRNMTGGS